MRLFFNFMHAYPKGAPKVAPLIFLYWPTTSELDVGGMAVQVETSHQNFITFCCRATDNSRGAV